MKDVNRAKLVIQLSISNDVKHVCKYDLLIFVRTKCVYLKSLKTHSAVKKTVSMAKKGSGCYGNIDSM